jgi:hypothetical protein
VILRIIDMEKSMTEPASSQVVGLVAKSVMDVTSYSIVCATVIKLLPPLAALISILWIGFQFYHSEPMKEWRNKRKEK